MFFAKLLQAESARKRMMFLMVLHLCTFAYSEVRAGVRSEQCDERPPSKFALQHSAGFHCSGSSLGQGCRLGY